MKIKHILEIFDAMNIKDVTTDRQRKNGTTVFEIPYKNPLNPAQKYQFAEYETGYVRNLNSWCCYQINKRKTNKKTYTNYKGELKTYDSYERILIPKRKDRLKFLLEFFVRNYFSEVRTHVKYEYIEPFIPKPQEIQVIVDGNRYKIA